jgi:hypothetical protein
MVTSASGAVLSLGPIALVLSAAALAQVDPPERREPYLDSLGVDHREALLDQLVEDAISADPTDLLELLEGLLANPLDLNVATSVELALVPGLSPRLAAAIVTHRAVAGPLCWA